MINGWRDEPGVYGSTGKGQLVLGVKDENLHSELEKVASVLKKALNIKIVRNIEDAAHSKLVLNLGNALFTLVNIKSVKESQITKIRKISAGLLVEGLNLIQAAGYKPFKLKGYPSWSVIKAAQNAPDDVANEVFKDTVEKTWRNSMVQDMILRDKGQSELESLNGYMINLANSIGFDTPINKMVYNLCKEKFAQKPYKPLPVEIVWEKIQKYIKI